MFIVRQNNHFEESLPENPPDSVSYDQFPNEGQALSGPFKVPSDVRKKQYHFGNGTRDLIITSKTINIVQKIKYSNESGLPKIVVKEKRKPTVNKNSKPKQQVILTWCCLNFVLNNCFIFLVEWIC